MAGRNKKEPATLTATRPTAFTGRKWVRWTKKMKGMFLDHLAATCNVRASAAAIGVDPVCVYNLRRRDPAFVAEWDKALDHGYQLLETLLIGHALRGEGGRQEIEDGAPAFGKVEVDNALRLMAARRNAGTERAARGGPKPKAATREETNTRILKKLAAIEAREGGPS